MNLNIFNFYFQFWCTVYFKLRFETSMQFVVSVYIHGPMSFYWNPVLLNIYFYCKFYTLKYLEVFPFCISTFLALFSYWIRNITKFLQIWFSWCLNFRLFGIFEIYANLIQSIYIYLVQVDKFCWQVYLATEEMHLCY